MYLLLGAIHKRNFVVFRFQLDVNIRLIRETPLFVVSLVGNPHRLLKCSLATVWNTQNEYLESRFVRPKSIQVLIPVHWDCLLRCDR